MSSKFVFVPRAQSVFARADIMSRNVFGLIYDRWKLSNRPQNQQAFTDAYGVYCVYDRQDLAKELGVTLPTVRKAVKTLIDQELITARRAGIGAAWRYYVTVRAQLYLDDEFARDIASTLDIDYRSERKNLSV